MNEITRKWHVCICQKDDQNMNKYYYGLLLGVISGSCDIDAEIWYNPIIPINVVKIYAPQLLQSPLYLYHRELVDKMLRDEIYIKHDTPIVFQCTDDQFDEIKAKTEKYMIKALPHSPVFIWE